MKGNLVDLRALETSDFDFFYQCENDHDELGNGSYLQPMSGYIIKEFIQNGTRPVEETGQLRLVVVSKENEPIGFIDLFEVDFRHRRAGIGVMIAKVNRNQNFATEAVQLMCRYAKKVLNLELIFADIRSDNPASLRVFQKAGFSNQVPLPQWDCVAGKRIDCLRTFILLNIEY
jgi:diamine N-acetyltransferase